jgi:hypothetical protein
MKKFLYLAITAMLLTGCYEPYVKDYDWSGVYIAYQYDLRSLVVGEGMKFKVGAVLGGVINNNKDRYVDFVVDNALITDSLTAFGGTTAMDGMKLTPSQNYVSLAISKAGITSLTPVPSNLYSLSASDRIIISKGNHTGTMTFKADSLAFISDPNAGHNPYYAIAWRITSADADVVINEKSFGIIALRLENMFFGSWYHGGKSVVKNASGIEQSSDVYPTTIPSGDGTPKVYCLTTSGAFTCSTNYFHNKAGSMTIGMDGKKVTVSGPGIVDLGCDWNKESHIQNRKIFLNYKYGNEFGGFTEVTDTLTFRNRERDGVNEWQN